MFTCKKVQIHKTLTKSALLLSCATIYTTIIIDRIHVISGRPNSCIAATFVYYRGQVLYGVVWHDEACRRLLSTTGLADYVSQLTKKYGGQFSR